jgi:hypothetical protein
LALSLAPLHRSPCRWKRRGEFLRHFMKDERLPEAPFAKSVRWSARHNPGLLLDSVWESRRITTTETPSQSVRYSIQLTGIPSSVAAARSDACRPKGAPSMCDYSLRRGQKMAHDPTHLPCRSPAVTGRRRCRVHGGAPGSGGPKGRRATSVRPQSDQDAEVNRFTRLPRASANPTTRAIAVSSIKDKVAPEDPSRSSFSGCRG